MGTRRSTPLPIGGGHYCYTAGCKIHEAYETDPTSETLEQVRELKKI